MDSGGSDRVSGSTSTRKPPSELLGNLGVRVQVLTDYSELAREKMWARIYLIPALQAEEDRDQVRRYLADKAREKELLGTETKIYHSDRYVTESDIVLARVLANHLILDLFDLPLRSHLSTRQSRSEAWYWYCYCTYK